MRVPEIEHDSVSRRREPSEVGEMRRAGILGAAFTVAALMVTGTAFALGNGTGIVGSPHDFTDNLVNGFPLPIENNDANVGAWNNMRKEICRVCHVPHDKGAVRYGNQGLLWNHQLSTKASWSMYASDPTMLEFIDGTIEAVPTGTSKLCLGCHDGVSAINQYDGKTPADAQYGGGFTYRMANYNSLFAIGNTAASLTNSHPISITYDDANDKQLFDPATATMANGATVRSLLVNDRVECSTCHDVHDREAVPGTALLRERTKGDDVTGIGASALCLVCHDK